MGGLVLVIFAILVLAWILRRMPGIPGQGQQVIEILAVRVVGARERLLLVQVGEEQILLGMTPAGIRHLHTLRKNLDLSPGQPGMEPAKRPGKWPEKGDFAGLLQRFGSPGGDKT